MRKVIKAVKITVDIVMLALFIYLMSYRVTRALGLHAIFGATLFALFIVHHALNYRWYLAMFRGKYGFRRVLLLISDVALIVAMVLMAISSVGMSGAVVDLGVVMTQKARDLHIISTAWGYVLMALHLGFHLHSLLLKVRKHVKGTIFEYSGYVLLAVGFLLGVFAFVKSELWQDLFLLRVAHTYVSEWLFYVEYVGILLLGAIIMHLILSIETLFKRKRIERETNKKSYN